MGRNPHYLNTRWEKSHAKDSLDNRITGRVRQWWLRSPDPGRHLRQGQRRSGLLQADHAKPVGDRSRDHQGRPRHQGARTQTRSWPGDGQLLWLGTPGRRAEELGRAIARRTLRQGAGERSGLPGWPDRALGTRRAVPDGESHQPDHGADLPRAGLREGQRAETETRRRRDRVRSRDASGLGARVSDPAERQRVGRCPRDSVRTSPPRLEVRTAAVVGDQVGEDMPPDASRVPGACHFYKQKSPGYGRFFNYFLVFFCRHSTIFL